MSFQGLSSRTLRPGRRRRVRACSPSTSWRVWVVKAEASSSGAYDREDREGEALGRPPMELAIDGGAPSFGPDLGPLGQDSVGWARGSIGFKDSRPGSPPDHGWLGRA